MKLILESEKILKVFNNRYKFSLLNYNYDSNEPILVLIKENYPSVNDFINRFFLNGFILVKHQDITDIARNLLPNFIRDKSEYIKKYIFNEYFVNYDISSLTGTNGAKIDYSIGPKHLWIRNTHKFKYNIFLFIRLNKYFNVDFEPGDIEVDILEGDIEDSSESRRWLLERL